MLPQLNRIRKAETYISVFRGLNRTVNTGFSRVSSNNQSIYTEFKEMKNLCSDDFPQLRTRRLRSRAANGSKIISNMLAVNNGLIYLDETGKLHIGSEIYTVPNITLNIYHKLVMFGNNVLIFPEKIIFSLGDKQFSKIEQENTVNEFINKCGAPKDAGKGLIMQCSIRKTVIADKYIRDSADLETRGNTDTTTYYTDGKLEEGGHIANALLENGSSRPSVLFKNSSGKLTEIYDSYVKIRATGIGNNFKSGDFIQISGMTDSLYDISEMGFSKNDIDDDTYISVLNNRYFKIYEVAVDYIIIKANIEVSVPYNGEMTISKMMPESDFFAIEVNNRLWTCSSKNNEIYASKQGDSSNWYAYSDGIATDSFAMTVGSEGDFTGIARQNDSVIFFKENWVLKIYGSKPSNYTLATYNVAGVARGSEDSIVWINGILYYLSQNGVCRYSPGGQPEVISQGVFGNTKYSNAVAGRHKDKYYISALNDSGEYELFAFDTTTGIWCKEDNTHMLCTATYNNIMYYVDADTGHIMSPDIKDNLLCGDEAFEEEKSFEWDAETGDMYDSEFSAKHISRIFFGVKLEKDAEFKVYAQYEDDGSYQELKTVRYDKKKPQMLPVAVRRSDYLKIRIVGKGQCNIYGILIEYAYGSR